MASAGTSCPLDLANRSRFYGNTIVLEEGKFWYIIGYYDADGQIYDVSINAIEHVAHFHQMPPGAGDEFFTFSGIARTAIGLTDEEASNWSANMGPPASGAKVARHMHVKPIRARAGMPHSGLGIAGLRTQFDLFYLLLMWLQSELDNLAGTPGATTGDYRALVADAHARLKKLVVAKFEADAYPEGAMR
jgi:hypothetical protein